MPLSSGYQQARRNQEMTNAITPENCKSYATEANLDKALEKMGLSDYRDDVSNRMSCRYIKCQNGEGRWTAVFMVSEFFNVNKTGGYVGFASRRGFMSV
jgi:hypothetical protein